MRQAPVVWGLIAVNTVLLLVAETLGGSQDLGVMLDLGAQPTPLPRSELWRMVTSTFLHFGLLHLAVNLYALWLFGPLFERFVGHARFVALYLASGLVGGAVVLLLTARRSDGPRPLERRGGNLGLVGSGVLVVASLAIGFLAATQAG